MIIHDIVVYSDNLTRIIALSLLPVYAAIRGCLWAAMNAWSCMVYVYVVLYELPVFFTDGL